MRRARLDRITRLALVGCLVGLVGCRPPSDATGTAASRSGASSRTVEAELVDGPALGEARVRVRVELGGEPVEDATVEVRGDMTHAGMAPVLAEATAVEPGVYVTRGFEFTMAGDWIVTAEVVFPDGETLSRVLTLNVPGR